MSTHVFSARKPKILGIFVMLSLLVNLASPAITAAAPRLKINPAAKTTTRAIKTKPKVKVVQPTNPTPLGQIKVSLSEQVVSQDVVNGTSEVPLVAFNFENTSQQLVAIEELTLTGYLNETGTGGFAIGFDQYLDIKDVITSLRLFNENNHSASPSAEFEEETGRATFALNFRLPPGRTRTLTAVGNIASTYTDQYFSSEQVALDLQDVSEDIKLKLLTTPVKNPVRKRDLPNVVFPRLTGDDPNGAFEPVVITNLVRHGNIQVMEAEYPVLDQTAIAGDQDILTARYQVTAGLEDFEITGLQLEQANFQCNEAIEAVRIKYPTDLLEPQLLDGIALAAISFSPGGGPGSGGYAKESILHAQFNPLQFGEDHFMVPQNQPVNFEVYVDTFDTENGTDSGCQLQLDFDGNYFGAIGQDSGYVLDESTVDTVYANQTILYKSFPIAQTHHEYSPEVITQGLNPVYAFLVASANDEEPVSLHKLTFDLSVEGISTGTLATSNGIQLYQTDEYGYPYYLLGSGTWNEATHQISITPDSEIVIPGGPGGVIKYFKLYAPLDIDFSAPQHEVRTRLAEDFNEPSEMTFAAAVDGLQVWSDLHETPHSLTSPDWTNGYSNDYFPTMETVLTEVVEPYVSVNFNGPNPNYYAIGSDDAAFLNLTLVSNTNVEVRNLPYYIYTNGDWIADPEDLLNNYQGTANFTDIKIMDLDNGELLTGPLELDTTHATGTGSHADDVIQYFTFDEPFFLVAGESKNISLTMDIAANEYLDSDYFYFYTTFLQSGHTSFYDMYGNPIPNTYPSSNIIGNQIRLDEDPWQATAHIDFQGPGTGSYTIGSDDVSFFDFSISVTGQAVEVRGLQIKVQTATGDAYADREDLLDSQTGTANFTDIKIIDRNDPSVIVMGPQELDSSHAYSTHDDDVYQNINFTDSFIIQADETKNLRVTMDIAENGYLDQDKIRIELNQSGYEIYDLEDNPVLNITPPSNIVGNYHLVDAPTASVQFEELEGPSSQTYPTTSNDVSFFDFSVNASINPVEIRQLQFRIRAATGNYTADRNNLLDNELGTANFTDIKLTDLDTGETIAGPISLSTVNANQYSQDDYWQYVYFTDSFQLDNDETKNLSLTMDIADNPYLDGERIYVGLYNPDDTSIIQDLVYDLPVHKIDPYYSLYGNTMTVSAPSLLVTRFSYPDDITYFAGDYDVALMTFDLTPGETSDIKVNRIKLTGFLDENAFGGYAQGFDNDVSLSEVVTYVAFHHYYQRITDWIPIDYYSGEVEFNETDFLSDLIISAGITSQLGIRGKISSSAYYNNTPEMITFDIADASLDIGVEAMSGPQAKAVGNWPNCGGSICDYPADNQADITISTRGDIQIMEPYQQVRDNIAVTGTDDLLVVKYKVFATSEDFKITDLTLEQNSNHSACNAAIEEVTIKYPTNLADPANLDGNASSNAPDGRFHFGTLNFMVPRERDDVNFEVYVNTFDYQQIPIADCKLQIDFDGDSTSEFQARGETSGVNRYYYHVDSVQANQTGLYKSIPLVETNYNNSPSSIISGTAANIYAFDVTSGSSQNAIGLNRITFEISPTGLIEGDLEEANGIKLYTLDQRGEIRGVPVGSGTWSFDDHLVTVFFDEEFIVPAGQTQRFMLKAPITIDSEAQQVRLSTRIMEEEIMEFITSNNAYAVQGNFAWSDRHIDPFNHSFNSPDWTNGYRVYNLEEDPGLILQ